jgi:tRNA(Arg) A34 adenosine deaminase TadA
MTKRQHITAVVYDKHGRTLAVGQNSYIKTHTMMKRHGQKVGIFKKEVMHAECAAIVKVKDLSKAYRIGVFRFNASGEPLLAKPCPICESMIKEAGIKVVEWTY